MEEQVSHISDLEGLNSELEGFLSDLHGREEALSARIKELEDALTAARGSSAAAMNLMAQKEASLVSALEDLRVSLHKESSKAVSLTSERDQLSRKPEMVEARLEEAKAAAADKERSLNEARAAAKQETARAAAAAEELRASLQQEGAKTAALTSERDQLLRKLEVVSARLEEGKAAAADKERSLNEVRAAAKQEAARAAAAAEELRASLNKETSRSSALGAERETLLRQLAVLSDRLADVKALADDKDTSLKEARAAAKQDAARAAAAAEELRVALQQETARVSSITLERDDLARRVQALEGLLDEAKSSLAGKDILINEARAAARAKEVELGTVIDQLRSSVLEESSKAALLVSERDGILRRLEAEGHALEAEKSRSAEKDMHVSAARGVIKEKEDEIERILRGVEELKAALMLERANVKDREAHLQKALKLKEGLERRLESAAQESSRSEEGFLLKIDLVKKELSEQAKRTAEVERKLAAAGARLDEALEAAAQKARMLAETEALLAEKDAQLKAANLKMNELAKEFAQARKGGGRENEQRAAELAASLAARVEELEASLAETSAQSLEKFRASQAELSGARSALRLKEEENASLKARESSLSGELADAEEKWKLASAQLHNAVSRLRNAENDNEIALGRLKSVEEERDRFRAAALKAETAASAMVLQESSARDGEASGLMAAIEEQAAKYTELLRKYDDVVLTNETILREKAGAKAEAESLRAALKAEQDAAEAAAGEKRGLQSGSAEKLRGAEAQLRKKEFELEEARASAVSAGAEASALRARLQELAAAAAGEAEVEKVRYAALSEKMHNADALLKKKEFELEEARGALSALDNECSLLRASRASLEAKYAREIQAENELLKEARGKIVERDSAISRLSVTEDELKKETEALKKEKQALLSLVCKKSAAPAHSAKVSEAERLLQEKESRLVKLRAELENTRAEKAELQGREKELREELKARPYRAMLREAEDKLLIKEKMLAEVDSRMKKIGRDFAELKGRGQSSGAPGYIPDFEELVAGVAHQVANSISIIRSHAEFCAETPEAEGAKESLNVIVRNIVNLQKKIDTIMNFSRPVIPQRSPERLDAVVSEVLAGLRDSGRLEKINVRMKGGEKLKPLSLDRVRFASAVEQLLLNAADAMPGGGELSLAISGHGGKQRLEVSDTGAGIEKKNMSAVFHPFFTTKPGRMGLGLTLARNVARAHGGTLELLSGPGSGATAVLEVPEI